MLGVGLFLLATTELQSVHHIKPLCHSLFIAFFSKAMQSIEHKALTSIGTFTLHVCFVKFFASQNQLFLGLKN